MILPILKDKQLSKDPAKFVENITQDIKDLAINMCITMSSKRALGIAAPQVGVPLRIIVINTCTFTMDPNSMGCTIMINPEIIDTYGKQENLEGCLSFPKEQVKVIRHKRVRVKWITTQGIDREQEFIGLSAACVEHEIDHLEGKTMYDEDGWKL